MEYFILFILFLIFWEIYSREATSKKNKIIEQINLENKKLEENQKEIDITLLAKKLSELNNKQLNLLYEMYHNQYSKEEKFLY